MFPSAPSGRENHFPARERVAVRVAMCPLSRNLRRRRVVHQFGPSSDVGILCGDHRPLAVSPYEHLHHDAIPGTARGAVSILVSPHSPPDVSDGNVSSQKLNVRARDGPHALLKLHGMCSRLQLLELASPIQNHSRHVHEADVFCNERAERPNVVPIPRIIPPRLYFPNRFLIIGRGGRDIADQKRQNDAGQP